MKNYKTFKLILIALLTTVCIKDIHSQTPTYAWAKTAGGADFELTASVATDSDGNVFATGTFEGSVDFDPGPANQTHTSNGFSDIFVQKFDPSGNLLWVRTFGSVKYDEGIDLDVDHLGNVYITGKFEGTVDFAPGGAVFNLTSTSSNPQSDVFVLKLNPIGKLVWARGYGSQFGDKGTSIKCSLKAVHITGTFYDVVDFDPGVGVFNLGSSGVGSNSFVQKLDLDGIFMWATDIDGSHSVVSQSIEVDKYGNVISAGSFAYSTVDFNPGTGTFYLTAANADGYVQKLDRNGNFLWAHGIHGTGNGDEGRAVEANTNGDVYIMGHFYGTCDFDPGVGTTNITSSGTGDIYIQKVDASGNFMWVKTFGGTAASDYCTNMDLDNNGNLYNVGYYYNTVDFDPNGGVTNQTSAGGSDIFIQKLDPNGNLLWVRSIGNTDQDWAQAVDIDDFNSIITGGAFSQTVDFDPDVNVRNFTANGWFDAFVQKMGQCSGTMTASVNEIQSPVWPYGISALEAEVTGSNGPFSYVWVRFSSVISTTNQAVSPCSQATYELTVTDLTTGCTATYNYYFSNSNNSVCYDPGPFEPEFFKYQEELKEDWALFPNPSDGTFNVQLDQWYTSGNLEVTNLTGQKVYEQELKEGNLFSIDLNEPSGVYLIHVTADNRSQVFRFTIK